MQKRNGIHTRVTGTVRWLLAALLLLLCGTALGGTKHYYYTDPQGTPLAKADAQGNIVERYEYTPYGVPVPSVGAAPNGPGYTGHVNDPEAGLVYMQARYYDPAVGRFLSVDPVTTTENPMAAFNRYWYANNNPARYTDPDGRCPQCLWGAPIGAGVNIIVQMATAKGSFSERFSHISWGQVAVATAAGALSGGVSAIASTATTTAGAIGANVVGNMAVGAVATQAGAQVEGRTASAGEVAKGAVFSGAASGLGAAIEGVPGAISRSNVAGMSQTERVAAENLLDGIKKATPGFKYTNPTQTAANTVGASVSASSNLLPIVENKKDVK